MKTKIIIYGIGLVSVLASAEENVLLSTEKQTILQEQLNQYEAEHQKLRTNWIAPLNLNGTYSHDKSAAGDYHSDLQKVSASISQDIFRSGGITYQIDYADAKFRSDSLAVKQQRANLNLQLFTALLNYRKSLYQLQQSDQRLKNKEIEIFLKRQQYEAGKADITQLNNALMDKSTELKTYSGYQYAVAQQRFEIAKLSDLDPDAFPLPEFSLVEKEDFLSRQLDLQYARALSSSADYSYRVTKSNYLPALSLNAAVGYQNLDQRELSGDYDGHYYSAGISLNFPLTYNSSYAIQEAKAAHLAKTASAADKQREIDASYRQSLELIESYRRYIEITKKNLILYDELIAATKAGVDAGYKTGYDLQTLQNTKSVDEFEIRINEINIQIELAKLHFALNNDKDL